jgi:hypothetical protein
MTVARPLPMPVPGPCPAPTTMQIFLSSRMRFPPMREDEHDRRRFAKRCGGCPHPQVIRKRNFAFSVA